MKYNKIFKIIIAAITLAFVFALSTHAQNVIRQGDTFIQQCDSTTVTKYRYKTKDGKSYPVYLSSRRKAFIIKTSKKTGKEYRQYLPKITEAISKEEK